ncbi:MAG: type II secretion system major pseudopilin GspG [Candidatus Brocadiia bacterium]
MPRRVPHKACLNRAAGFTLVELMIVIVIVGILATLIMPRVLDRPEQARRVKAKAQISSFTNALGMYKADTGQFPTTAQGLEALVSNPGVEGWQEGGYLQHGKLPKDPWGNDYVYMSPGTHSTDYDIVSYGRDGEPGGTDFDADIQSWNLQED